MAICDDLRRLFPKYVSTHYERDSVTIREREKAAKVRNVVWTNSCFQHIDPSITKDQSDFFRQANSSEIFHLDCDGITLFEANGRKYMFLSELKSTFDSGDIYHAKNQILSSFLKINMLMHLTIGYRIEDYIVKGFIFSRPFKKSYMIDLYRAQFTSPKRKYTTEAQFILDLCYHGHSRTTLTPNNVYELKGLPLGERGIFRKIEMHHIAVPEGTDSIALDVNNYL